MVFEVVQVVEVYSQVSNLDIIIRERALTVGVVCEDVVQVVEVCFRVSSWKNILSRPVSYS